MRRSVAGFARRAVQAAFALSFLALGRGQTAATDGVRDWMARGLALQEKGDYEGAIAEYSRVLAVDPEHPDAQYELAFATFFQGDYARTIAIAEKAIAEKPDCRSGYYVFLGTSHGMLDAWPKGEEVLRRGLAIWPDDASLHFNLGVNLGAQGRFDPSAAEFEEALRRSPYQAANWRALGDSLDRAGRKGRAFAAYARSLTLDEGSKGAERAARRLREMILEGARPVTTGDEKGSLRIGVSVPPGSSSDALTHVATESMGMGLVAALRYDGEWKGKSDSRFFVYAVDQVLRLMSALKEDDSDHGAPFWEQFVYTYFDEGRAAGHMEALAYDLLSSTGDPEAIRWRDEHGDADRRYRDWSERWAVNWR
jgi:tetratricopeptide (TPR) repeat protein